MTEPCANMPRIVSGNARIDEAKMTGMTPPVLTLSGMCVLDPPYIRRPTTRLAYWTVTRRWPRSTKMIAPTTRIISTIRMITEPARAGRARICSNVCSTAAGKLTTIPAKMMSDMPLPMPRSVICSPSHMMNAVPVVSVSTVMRRKHQPGL